MEKVKFKKYKKLSIIICIAVIILIIGIIAGVFIIKSKNANREEEQNLPILPCGMKFGMSLEEVAEIDFEIKPELEYVTMDKSSETYSYSPFLKSSYLKDFFGLKSNLLDEKESVNFAFNCDKELYEYSLSMHIPENIEAKDIIDYYSECFDKKYNFDSNDIQFIEFDDKNTYCSVYFSPKGTENKYDWLLINVSSKKYKPVYHNVPESKINEAYNNYSYNIDGFKINLIKLLNNCSNNYSATYDTYRNAKLDTEKIPFDIRNKMEDDSFELSEYLSTAYYLEVEGEICENPDIPYLVSDNKKIISLIIFFDKNDQVKGYYKINECSELNTAAILTIF